MKGSYFSRILTIFLVVFAWNTAAGNIRSNSDELLSKKISISAQQRPLFEVFIRLVYVYDIPIGLEESIYDRRHRDYFFQTNVPPENEVSRFETHLTPRDPRFAALPVVTDHLISLNFRDSPLEFVLDELVRQMGFYDWKLVDGVINIYPRTGRDSRLEKLLLTSVKSFSVPMGTEVGSIQSKIVYGLPEYRSFVTSNGLFFDSEQRLAWYLSRPLPASVRLSGVTFLELLNETTRVKRGGWILRIDERRKGTKVEEFVEIIL